MFTVYIINHATGSQKVLRPEYTSRDDAEARAGDELAGKRSFVEAAVMNRAGRVVSRYSAGVGCTLYVETGARTRPI